MDAIPTRTPLPSSLPLLKATPSDKRCDQLLEYQKLTGSLNHLASFSRPDISYAVSHLSQFNSDPTTTHMKAAKHVLRYLKGTRFFCITYGCPQHLYILGFSDADYGGDRNDRVYYTGYLIKINNAPVSWTSHKQT